jgi:hypothetical protein
MAGSKTRFGFSGADEPLPLEGLASGAPRAAVTLTGHETHCASQATSPKPAKIQVQDVARVSASRSGVPETVVREEVTERLADRGPHTGKSKFPAIARLLGRWTKSGVFLSRSRILDADDTMPKLPREVWPSRIAIFLGAALLSFLIALAVMKLGPLK